MRAARAWRRWVVSARNTTPGVTAHIPAATWWVQILRFVQPTSQHDHPVDFSLSLGRVHEKALQECEFTGPWSVSGVWRPGLT